MSARLHHPKQTEDPVRTSLSSALNFSIAMTVALLIALVLVMAVALDH